MQKIQINGVDIEINVPSQEELTLLKGQLEAAKKVISDLKTANNHLVGDVRYAAQKIEELKKKNATLKQQLAETRTANCILQKDRDFFKKQGHEMAQKLVAAKREIQELCAKCIHLQKDMDGTLLALADEQQTAKENAATCCVLRDKLDSTRAHLDAAEDASKFWYNQYNAVNDKLQEIKKVLK